MNGGHIHNISTRAATSSDLSGLILKLSMSFRDHIQWSGVSLSGSSVITWDDMNDENIH